MSAATNPELEPVDRRDAANAPEVDLRAGRRKVARSRGALSGILLLILGLWAGLAPFIGPYFDFGFEPRSGDAWHWTSGRGLYEVLPGGVAALAGLVLLLSASRFLTVLLAWLAALAGAWLVVGPSLDVVLDVGVGSPPADAGDNKVVALTLLYFFATGVAIALVAGIALGRLSVHSVRDVQAAERRAEAEAAAAAEAERQEAERREAERQQAERLAAERRDTEYRATEYRDTERRDSDYRDTERVHHDRQGDDRDVDPQRTDRDATTATYPVVDGDSYAAPPAGPYDASGTRDAAGTSGYAGHRSMGRHDAESSEPASPPITAPATQPSGAPPAAPVDDAAYRSDQPPLPVDPATANPQSPAADQGHDPAAPPPPGGTEQYRYGAPQYPTSPEERER